MNGIVRALIAGCLTGFGLIIFCWSVITWGKLPMVFTTRTETKIEYKHLPPSPPPTEFSTGPVYIKLGWYSKINEHADGEYQLESADGMIRVIELCAPQPDFRRGDLLEIFYSPPVKPNTCLPFIRAHMIKRAK
jgi:hypothetical protein